MCGRVRSASVIAPLGAGSAPDDLVSELKDHFLGDEPKKHLILDNQNSQPGLARSHFEYPQMLGSPYSLSVR